MSSRILGSGANVRLGVIFSPDDASDVQVIEGIYPAAMHVDYQVLLSALTPTRDANSAVKELIAHPCEALIVVGSHMSTGSLRKFAAEIPVVSVGAVAPTEEASWDVIRSSDDIGVERAVDHLHELGHRQIAYIHGQRMQSAKARYQGYLRAMEKHGMISHTVTTAAGIEECGANIAQMLLSEAAQETAVVAGNDYSALSLIHAVLRAGADVPGYVSVAGFDDNRIVQLSYMNMTAVHQDWAAMGRFAVQAAVERITGTREEPTEKTITPALVVRGSTARPRSTDHVPVGR
jgi:DNA-binding LacI/PurR family transcriptional regulator